MFQSSAPIGVIDAGLGGYTVVKELQALLPHEDILYFGDGKYQPYGNRSRQEILWFTRQMLDFFKERGAKAVAIACNTISTLLEEYEQEFPFPISSIVKSGALDAAALQPQKVVLLSTVFTANSGCYERYVHAESPTTEVIAQGCPWLARLIEDGTFDQVAIEAELRATLGRAAAAHPDAALLILGCTHFPLVGDLIQQLYPQFTRLINPAATQAQQIEHLLRQQQTLRTEGEGSLRVYTTSDCDTYRHIADKIGLKRLLSVELAPPLHPLAP